MWITEKIPQEKTCYPQIYPQNRKKCEFLWIKSFFLFIIILKSNKLLTDIWIICG